MGSDLREFIKYSEPTSIQIKNIKSNLIDSTSKNPISIDLSAGDRLMITGPSGSGKKYLAKLIHNKSKRSEAAFIAANTKRIITNNLENDLFGVENSEGVITKIGLIEQAHKGTLYIDEICNLDHVLQARLVKLLTEKVIQRVNGKYNIDINVRIICGTAKNIKSEIHMVAIDSDLFFTPIEDQKTFNSCKKVKKNIYYHEIKSLHGHDAFLIEYDQLNSMLSPLFTNIYAHS